MPTSNNSRLLAEGRRRKILELVEQTGQVTIHDVVKRFAVSAVTARSDLDALSTNGAVLRSHGGAVRYEPTQDYPLKLKATLHRSEKARIGEAAAQLVQPNETVILDSGTTTAEIAKNLKRSKVKFTVVTSALNIAHEPSISCRRRPRSRKWSVYGRRAGSSAQRLDDEGVKRSDGRGRLHEAWKAQPFSHRPNRECPPIDY